jgi:hypothetical protein
MNSRFSVRGSTVPYSSGQGCRSANRVFERSGEHDWEGLSFGTELERGFVAQNRELRNREPRKLNSAMIRPVW